MLFRTFSKISELFRTVSRTDAAIAVTNRHPVPGMDAKVEPADGNQMEIPMSRRSNLVLACGAMFAVSALFEPNVWAQSYQTLGPCAAVPGVWHWFSNATGYFFPDGTERSSNSVTAEWTCRRGRVKIYWSTGAVDDLAISYDGRNLSGFNKDSTPVSARRMGDL
jgi:hypothetical protein